MPDQSSMHPYLSWAKQRIDEMDATLASLEARASESKADTKAKAGELIADMKKRRDEFQANVKAQAEAGEAAWQTAKTQLESQWHGFQTEVNTYFEWDAKQLEQQHVSVHGGVDPKSTSRRAQQSVQDFDGTARFRLSYANPGRR